MKLNVANVWKDTQPSVKVAGAWKPLSAGFVNVAGVWKQFYAPPRVALSYVFSTNSLNPAPNVTGMPGYVAGKSDITITVNSGVYIWSNSATPALTILGGTTGDTITLINNGFIIGKGGNGDYWDGANYIQATVGNPAISINYPITLDNQNGYIGGGGGGANSGSYNGGGGAGGGLGGWWSGYTTAAVGGAIGAIGADGNTAPANGVAGGGAGGRIIPGTGGAKVTVTPSINCVGGKGGGAGGGGGASASCSTGCGPGGGGWGAKGGDTINTYASPLPAGSTVSSGEGGTAGAIGGSDSYTGAVQPTANATIGAAGGKAIVTNGKSVTYVGNSATRVYGIVG